MMIAALVTGAPTGCRLSEKLPGWWNGFREPAIAADMGLSGVDQYEPGKIPVVFVHGLLSDATTWSAMTAALAADPGIAARYQFWLYNYPTGVPYIKSGGELRSELAAAVQRLDPEGQDAALRRMVVVGHSMGGLLAKLQATGSGPALWDAVFKVPFDQFQTDPATREKLRQVFFFEPQPFVAQVIFIATPHDGSYWSEGTVGRLGARLVEFPAHMRKNFNKLVQENRLALPEDAPTSPPTSVEHLSPGNAVVRAVRDLPFGRHVGVHTIHGEIPRLLSSQRGDGVVPASSAHLADADSELVVPTSHWTIHHDARTIEEVRRILHQHADTTFRIPPSDN